MEQKIIYQKVYHRVENSSNVSKEDDDFSQGNTAITNYVRTLVQDNLQKQIFTLMSDRIDGQKQFIETAIEVSKCLE